MTLSVDIEARFGNFALSATFETRGGLTALFGPSGSGKTSLMEMIGGIRRPTRGRIVLDGMRLTDSDARLHVSPHRRRIGCVFQETRLFPHLTGRQNLNYGQWFTPKRERREDLDRVVDLLGLSHLLDRRPEHYSGGERSRVAIGRALMASPRLLMMDEPLAALDDTRKAEIIPYIERLRDEGRMEILYVTHSVAEVVRLANGLVLMSGGRMVAAGPTTELLSRFDTGSALGEGEAGAIIEATIAAHDPQFGLSQLTSRAGDLYVPAMDLPIGTAVRLRVKARDVLIALDRPMGISALNGLGGVIVSMEPGVGANVNVVLDCGGDRLLASLTAKSAETLGLRPGKAVYAIIKSVSFDRLGLGARPVA
jgi:molybdate transport system ATP-binding protein